MKMLENIGSFLLAVCVFIKMVLLELVEGLAEKTGLAPIWRSFSKGERFYWQIVFICFLLWLAMLFSIGSVFRIAHEPLLWGAGMVVFFGPVIVGFVACPEKLVYVFLRMMRDPKSPNPYHAPTKEERHRYAEIKVRWLFRNKFLENKKS